MIAPFGCIVTAMVTPFKKTGDIHYDEAVRLAKHLLENGSDGILLSGTTGESPTTTHDEEYRLWETVLTEIRAWEKQKGRTPSKLIAGTGSNSTATSISSTQQAEAIGLDGAMIVVPYYNKPSQYGLYQHFYAIANSTTLPLMIYNIPGRTSKNMEPETTARIVADCPQYVALKAASGDLKQITKTREITPAHFAIYSGDDGLTLDILKAGGCGVVSVASHVAGVMIGEMIQAYELNNISKAEALNQTLKELFDVLFITSNPTPVKAALEMIGFDTSTLRLPMIPATESEQTAIRNVMTDLELL